jgi:hypothetical protein
MHTECSSVASTPRRCPIGDHDANTVGDWRRPTTSMRTREERRRRNNRSAPVDDAAESVSSVASTVAAAVPSSAPWPPEEGVRRFLDGRVAPEFTALEDAVSPLDWVAASFDAEELALLRSAESARAAAAAAAGDASSRVAADALPASEEAHPPTTPTTPRASEDVATWEAARPADDGDVAPKAEPSQTTSPGAPPAPVRLASASFAVATPATAIGGRGAFHSHVTGLAAAWEPRHHDEAPAVRQRAASRLARYAWEQQAYWREAARNWQGELAAPEEQPCCCHQCQCFAAPDGVPQPAQPWWCDDYDDEPLQPPPPHRQIVHAQWPAAHGAAVEAVSKTQRRRASRKKKLAFETAAALDSPPPLPVAPAAHEAAAAVEAPSVAVPAATAVAVPAGSMPASCTAPCAQWQLYIAGWVAAASRRS